MNNIEGSLKFFKNTRSKLILLSFMYLILGIISFISPIMMANLLAGLINTDFYVVFWYAIYVCLILILQEVILYLTERLWNIKVRPRILYNILLRFQY